MSQNYADAIARQRELTNENGENNEERRAHLVLESDLGQAEALFSSRLFNPQTFVLQTATKTGFLASGQGHQAERSQ
eukprot:1119930-Rhodomonas_salina.2